MRLFLWRKSLHEEKVNYDPINTREGTRALDKFDIRVSIHRRAERDLPEPLSCGEAGRGAPLHLPGKLPSMT